MAGGAVGSVEALLAVRGACLAGEVLLEVVVEVGAGFEAGGLSEEQVVEGGADGAGVGEPRGADHAGTMAGLAQFRAIIVIEPIIAFALF